MEGAMEEEIEIIEHADGTSSIKVVRSKKNCRDITHIFEQAKGEVSSRQPIANPGQVGQGVQNRR
jgi:hypothetical protein